jgi:UTP-glucose-1-phosphate uridylyltransferase
MIKQPHKAVILLGFGSSSRSDTYDGISLPPCTVDNAAVQQAVKEALSAGLKELIFVTSDSQTPVEDQFGGFDGARAERVVIARQFAARSVGHAVCGIRHLLEEEPFVLLIPADMQGHGETDSTARLLAAYRSGGGNLVAVGGDDVLQRDGSFAAVAAAPAGRYLLQPAVLDELELDPDAGLSGALLAIAEAWPLTVLPVMRAAAQRRPMIPTSETPTLRAPRPVALVAAAAAAARAEAGD